VKTKPLDRLAETCRRWAIYGMALAIIGTSLAIILPTSDLWWTCALIALGVWLVLMGWWGIAKVRRQVERTRRVG
jgi:hypothetical protein